MSQQEKKERRWMKSWNFHFIYNLKTIFYVASSKALLWKEYFPYYFEEKVAFGKRTDAIL
jgi:hypothetical protein